MLNNEGVDKYSRLGILTQSHVKFLFYNERYTSREAEVQLFHDSHLRGDITALPYGASIFPLILFSGLEEREDG